MKYTINPSTFEVLIFDGIRPEPFWGQPCYPNGEAFLSVAEATAWAVLAVASMTAPNPYPPNGRGMVGEPKLIPALVMP